MNETKLVSRLPIGWVPENTAVDVYARLAPGGHHWEAFAPDFSIAATGESPDEACFNVIDAVESYLLLMADQGKTFAEARQPLKMRAGVPMALELLLQTVRSRIGRPPRRMRRDHFRVPLRSIGAC